jgi:class 3 adenylate cyclase/tetratricopeptide (TPR) repeat protein
VNARAANFCGECGTELAPGREPAAGAAPQGIPTAQPLPGRSGAERQQLTVLFCDLVDSAALAARLDLEDLREVMRAYQRVCALVVTRFGGFVVRYMGDGLLAYFGYPAAYEDAAERAVRSGLALVEAVGKVAARFGLALQIRVGIATGTVVVGDLMGDGAAQEHAVMGEAPILAARLQALARPNTVVISSVTRRLAGGLFEYRSLGPVALKGFEVGVPIWRVLGESAVRGRFEALRAARLAPLVGRGEEMQLLLDRWERVGQGEGQVVVLVGEPGIGKSRLARAFEERVAGEALSLRYYCSPLYQDSALFPVISQLEHVAGFGRDDSVEQKLEKLEALLADTPTERETVGLIADLLSLPAGERYRVTESSSRRRREKTLQALLGRLEGLAARQPVLVVFEDVQWIDPTSSELLGLLAQRLARLRVMVLATARPEGASSWPDWEGATTIALTHLSQPEAGALVDRVVGGKALPRAIFEQILARSDGVPLFVEELTKAVLESGALREEDGRYTMSGALPAVAIPETLHDTLRARLDRHPEAREVAQVGAVIGREFPLDVLHAVADMAPDRLEGALDELVRSGMLLVRDEPPRAVYAFNHVLVRDAGYAALLRGRRQELHARVAATYEKLRPDVVDQRPDLVARHFTEAGLADRAVPYWGDAGRRSLTRSAVREAIAQLRQGLTLVATLPDCPTRARQELDLQMVIGSALILTHGFAAPQVEATYDRAHELFKQVGDAPDLFRVLFGLRSYNLLRGNLDLATELGDQMAAIAQRERSPALDVVARLGQAITLYFRGDMVAARGRLEQGIELYDPALHDALISLCGKDNGLGVFFFGAHVLWYLGYPDQARKRMRKALELARRMSDSVTLVDILDFDAWLHVYRREPAAVQQLAEADLAHASEQGASFFMAHATIFRGWALVEQGHVEDGLEQMRQGIAAYRATGAVIERAHFLGLLAEALSKTGRVADGLRAIDEALQDVDRHRACFYHAELNRIKGELLVQTAVAAEPRPAAIDEAERCFRAAIEIAKRQHAKSLELRAAVSLARHWQRQGRPDAAHELLAEVYAWFTEGFDAPDLQEARALLGRLVLAAHG